jgi:hypothetical protein
MNDTLRFTSAELIDHQTLILYLSDGTFLTVKVDEFTEKFPERINMADLGHSRPN